MSHDRQSQILVLPASSARLGVEQARQIIRTVIAEDTSHESQIQSSHEGDLIEWHISNRYYEAQVFFRISSTTLLQQQAPSSRSAAANGRARRSARQFDGGVTSDHQHVASKDTVSDDVDLDSQVRDVFAALALGPAPSQESRTEWSSSERNERRAVAKTDDKHLRALQDEVAGVQAVMVIVDRDQPLSEHRKLLRMLESPSDVGNEENSPALLSGFDLAISLIVALPSPLQDATDPTSLASVVGADEVEALYAGAGWEYVDLASSLDSHLDEEEDDDDEGNFEELDELEDEKQGFERVREALMTHTWPGLQRKHDRRTRSEVRGGLGDDADVNGGLDIQRALSTLRTELDAIDTVGTAEPTEKDEELARAFLARIQAAQSANLGGIDANLAAATDEAPATTRSAEVIQADLERFLQDEDVQWPGVESIGSIGANGQASSTAGTNGDAAWTVAANGSNARTTGSEAFDDDFSDFVQAQSPSNGHHAESADSLPFDEEELAFIGDEDDAVLLRALADAQSGGGDVQIDFESTLSAVMAHAERVRAITDHARRREEAARVALALLDQ